MIKQVLRTWLVWQFYEAPKFLLSVWNNYIMFATRFFSLTLIFKTFFSPWRRYSWGYPKNFNVGEFFSALIPNFFSRLIGAMVRIVLIIMGIIFQIFVVLTGLLVFIFWLIWPFLVLAGLIFIFNF
jgi:hypothetical protein